MRPGRLDRPNSSISADRALPDVEATKVEIGGVIAVMCIGVAAAAKAGLASVFSCEHHTGPVTVDRLTRWIANRSERRERAS